MPRQCLKLPKMMAKLPNWKPISTIWEPRLKAAMTYDCWSIHRYTRDAQGQAIVAVAAALKFSDMLSNLLRLMASKRRLFVLPQLLDQLRAQIAEHKGEVAVDVISAKALTKTQSGALAKTLAARIGKDIKINAAVDESLIGGLIVKMGSKMIDTSILSKLNSLQNAMKEVG
jgi:F-type H+-transporting ATPase subunit delta